MLENSKGDYYYGTNLSFRVPSANFFGDNFTCVFTDSSPFSNITATRTFRIRFDMNDSVSSVILTAKHITGIVLAVMVLLIAISGISYLVRAFTLNIKVISQY